MPKKIEVLSREVRLTGVNNQDYVCLTDIARYKETTHTDDLIRNWLRNRNTIEFLGLWEQINNPGFNPVEFDGFRKQAGLNSFTLTAKQWTERTGAASIHAKEARGCASLNRRQGMLGFDGLTRRTFLILSSSTSATAAGPTTRAVGGRFWSISRRRCSSA
jgi:KilA-N domain